MVKVGDKIRIVSLRGTLGWYKKGDVLTVKYVKSSLVYVKENPSPIIHAEYEVIEPIKVGDTVTLIDKPWETEVWKSMLRSVKKCIYDNCNAVRCVTGYYVFSSNGRYKACPHAAICDRTFLVPVDLLRKVDSKLDGKNADFACVDDLPPKKHRYTADQIEEAERMVYEILTEKVWGKENCNSVHFQSLSGEKSNKYQDEKDRENRGKPRTLCSLRNTYKKDFYARGVAFCAENDEWNDDIGRLVALCKATGRKLPDWV